MKDRIVKILEIENGESIHQLYDQSPYFFSDKGDNQKIIDSREYIVDTEYLVCDVLSIEQKFLYPNTPYLIEFEGFIDTYWYYGLSRVSERPLFVKLSKPTKN